MSFVRPVLNESLGGVGAIVQHDDDGVQTMPKSGRQLHPGHLKSTIAHENKRTAFGNGQLRPNRPPGTAKPIEA